MAQITSNGQHAASNARAVVLGIERPRGLAALRSLARAGVPVVVVDHASGSQGSHSRYLGQFIRVGNDPAEQLSTLERLGREGGGVLLPTNVKTLWRHRGDRAVRGELIGLLRNSRNIKGRRLPGLARSDAFLDRRLAASEVDATSGDASCRASQGAGDERSVSRRPDRAGSTARIIVAAEGNAGRRRAAEVPAKTLTPGMFRGAALVGQVMACIMGPWICIPELGR